MRGTWQAALALCIVVVAVPARAMEITEDLSVSGYGDLRLLAPSGPVSWLDGGIGKFRYGRGDTLTAEAFAQVDAGLTDDLHAVVAVRAEPRTPGAVDIMEAYMQYAPLDGGDTNASVKTGAFYPAISLENDDIGWTSPYTLTPSAINSWTGDELRTIGSELTLKQHTSFGTFSVIAALLCCNDEAGILMADRGWAMDDRPTGLLERIRLPVATQKLFGQPAYARTGMFDEIDGHPGWYAGVNWQLTGIGKISVLRYDNDADSTAHTTTDTAWDTRFWSVGARTDIGPLVIISQGMIGQTVFKPRPNVLSDTKFRSAFLLASYDLGDWRFSAREDLFQTRHVAATVNPMSEDGNAFTASISWSGEGGLRLTGEAIAMRSRRGEYALAGLGSAVRDDNQFQFDARYFF